MLEGMYSAAAGMAAQQQRMDALSNDVANVNTTGYKRVRVAFRDLLYSPQGLAAPNSQEGAGSAATIIGRGSTQGSLQETGEPLDVALQGPGFLQARRADGTVALTRDGHLRVDDRRRLTTSDGLLLEPAVTLPAGASAKDVKISDNGTVRVGGRQVGRLGLVNVPAPDRLEAAGANLFLPTPASGAVGAAGAATTVRQGAVEASTVDIASAMTDLIESQRALELAGKAINAQDQALDIANSIKR